MKVLPAGSQTSSEHSTGNEADYVRGMSFRGRRPGVTSEEEEKARIWDEAWDIYRSTATQQNVASSRHAYDPLILPLALWCMVALAPALDQAKSPC